MKKATRIIALILTLVMLASFAACSETKDPTDGTDPANSPATTVAPGIDDPVSNDPVVTTEDIYDENGYLKSNLPELDYKQEKITVLWWTDVEKPEFFVESEMGDPISDAIYKRNANVESKLNIQLDWSVSTKGQYNNGVGAAYANFIGNMYDSGSNEIDLFSAHSRTIALCSQYGYCANLLEADYLDFSMPWWPQKMVETATIGNALYYVTGDCSTNALHMMYTLFFNKTIMENNNIEDPSQLVLDDKWTIEAFHRVTKGLYQDLDSSNSLTLDDAYGFTTLNWHLDAIYYGCDMILVENDPDDLLVISPDYTSEKASNLSSAMYEWITAENIYTKSDYGKTFANGNVFMSIGRNKDIMDQLIETDLKFGIVPAPKYDENQENYITVLGNPVSFYAIYSSSKDINRAAAVLECWASEAFRTTTPAIFEQTMKLRYSDTSVESTMYDIMRNGLVFDVGRYYNSQLDAMSDKWDNSCISGQNWLVASKQYEKLLARTLKNIAKAYMDIQS